MRRLLVVALILSAISAPQLDAAGRKLLLPVVISRPSPGAFGSTWATTVTVLNTGPLGIPVFGLLPRCTIEPCTYPPVPPSKTLEWAPAQGVSGRFLYVPEEVVSQVIIKLRVHDQSREHTNFGTEIPVIDETNAATDTVELLGIANSDEFRALVRMYDFDPANGHAVRVRVFLSSDGFSDDTLLAETVVSFRLPSDSLEDPGYAELPLNAFSAVSAGRNLRVEVSPINDGLRFWAFASVTNNATQHVTIVTP